MLTEYGAWVRERIIAEGDDEVLRERWSHSSSRRALADVLSRQGIDLAELVEAAGLGDSDPLDALLQLAWNVPSRTRAERVRQVPEQHARELLGQSVEARAVLEGLLTRYEEFGVEDLETTEVFASHLSATSALRASWRASSTARGCEPSSIGYRSGSTAL